VAHPSHAFTHILARPCSHVSMHVRLCPSARCACMHGQACARTHAFTRAHKHARTPPHTHARTHARTSARTRVHPACHHACSGELPAQLQKLQRHCPNARIAGPGRLSTWCLACRRPPPAQTCTSSARRPRSRRRSRGAQSWLPRLLQRVGWSSLPMSPTHPRCTICTCRAKEIREAMAKMPQLIAQHKASLRLDWDEVSELDKLTLTRTAIKRKYIKRRWVGPAS